MSTVIGNPGPCYLWRGVGNFFSVRVAESETSESVRAGDAGTISQDFVVGDGYLLGLRENSGPYEVLRRVQVI